MDKVIKEVAKGAGFKKIVVTSAKRSEDKQINTMYTNLMKGGNWEKNAAKWKDTYGSKGDKIIDSFLSSKRAEMSEEDILDAMKSKATEVGFKSAHSDYKKIAAIDFGKNSNNLNRSSVQRLVNAAKQNPSINPKTVKDPYSSTEDAVHIEIYLEETKSSISSSKQSQSDKISPLIELNFQIEILKVDALQTKNSNRTLYNQILK